MATVTPATIRDGDPAALAALCERRGGTVLAYCEQIVAPGQAIAAAAGAFASFRAAVIGPEELTGAQAEALLRGLARRSATSRGVNAPAGMRPSKDCLNPAVELVDYVEDALSAVERNAADSHIARCRLCAAVLQQLREGERAYREAGTGKPPPNVSAVLLEALVTAAPVRVQGLDEASAHAEGLRLLTGNDGATEPATPPPAFPSDLPPAEATIPPPEIMPPPATDPNDFDAQAIRQPVPVPPPSDPLRVTEDANPREPLSAERRLGRRRAAAKPGRVSKPARIRQAWRTRSPVHHARLAALLRGAGRLLAVVVLAGAAGALLGIGLAALTGDDTTSAPPLTGKQTSSPASPANDGASTQSPASTAAEATTTTPTTESSAAPISTGGKLRVDVLSTIVRPVTASAGDTRQRARVGVHVRVTNATGRVVEPSRPTLRIGDARLNVANTSSQAASPLLKKLAVGATADGRLRFDAEGALTDQLTVAPIKLRIVSKTVTLAPVVGDAVAPG